MKHENNPEGGGRKKTKGSVTEQEGGESVLCWTGCQKK